MTDKNQITVQVEQWLDQVVIGLDLCPFAARPRNHQAIRITTSQAQDLESVLNDVQAEMIYLDSAPVETVETTLLVLTAAYTDFLLFNELLYDVNDFIEQAGWEGVFQVASFHPQYQFSGTEPDDRENLTNRAPYPILHLIREASLEQALSRYPNPETIPERNISTVASLTDAQLVTLFPYLSAR